MPIKVGINGFGRIGRAILKIVLENTNVEIVAINDIVDDINNISYLYNYDSVYGRAEKEAIVNDKKNEIIIDQRNIKIFTESDIYNVPWQDFGIDLIIDSSGVYNNIISAKKLIDKKIVKKIIVTHSPRDKIDYYLILGINDNKYDHNLHHIISSSICDTNAIIHPLKTIEDYIGINSGSVTTLHPWLSYQNLVDAPLRSQSNPQHFWKDFSLGRSSFSNLIPKNTTAIDALGEILPELAIKLTSFSYRVPIPIVASADLTLNLRDEVSEKYLKELLLNLCKKNSHVTFNKESLVSKDYEKTNSSAIIDFQWIKVNKKLAKIVLWYDNEWGYCNRVNDIINHLIKKFDN